MNKPAMIKTQRLTLRPLCDSDRAAVTELLLSEEIAKTYMLPEFKSPAEAEKLFEAYMRLSNAPDRFVYGIDLDGRVIGLLNETEKTDDKMELGYLIHPAHWSKGYATETLAACIKALVELGYGIVSAGFFEENIASKRVMEKCGLRPASKEATITYREQVHRCIYYQLLLAKKNS